MSILYYFGLTQIVAGKIAWMLGRTMGTTAIETFGVASNIFLSGVSNPESLYNKSTTSISSSTGSVGFKIFTTT